VTAQRRQAVDLGHVKTQSVRPVHRYVVAMVTLGPVSAIATALGEEIDWRGFLRRV